MRTYEEALQHYNKSKAPKRSKKWAKYSDNPRYLKNVAATHMGIHKRDDGAIYYRLYSTDVAIFYPPQPDGTRKVETNYYSSQMTNIFMYSWNLNYYYHTTTDGKEVRVPYVSSWDGKGPSATLWFTAEGKLIVDKSEHRDIYTFKSSAEDKQRRKEFKAKLNTLMTLAMFRLPEYRANAHLTSDYGQPFGTAYNEPDSISEYRRYLNRTVDIDYDNPQYIEHFLDLGQGVFEVLASKRAYDAHIPDENGGYRYNNSIFHTWNNTPEQLAKKEAVKKQIVEDLSAEDFKKSLTNRVLEYANIKRGTVKTPWGQFRDTIPRKWFT
jgi:hypothetical protein